MSAGDRRWLEVAARCPGDPMRHELLAEALIALGGRAVEDRGGWLVTHLPEPEDGRDVLGEARAMLEGSGLQGADLRSAWRAHEDWAETWKRGLEPRRVGERLVVRPSWCAFDPRPGDIVLVLDPGMAFGNAEHGTTRGCLRLLERAVKPGMRVLDVGSGSGVLAVAAARLGAVRVLALEGDPLATEALALNVASNGGAGIVETREVWADPASLAQLGPWDGVVANIESGVLRALLPGLRAAVATDGWLIVSGVLAEEWPGVRADFETAGFALSEVDEDGEWRSARFHGAAAADVTPLG